MSELAVGHASAGHGSSAPSACSVGFDRVGASAWGTAAQARFFVAVEQSGPWGPDAAAQSHLPPGLGPGISQACTSRGGRLSLIRRPGPHPDLRHGGGRMAYLAWAGTSPWLLRATVEDPAAVLDLDWDAMASGDMRGTQASLAGAEPAEPVLLLCTNGRRDVCCALRGRPVALAAGSARPGQVWEASHTGGHRFAPTGVLLPHGATLARLDEDLCTQVIDAAGAGALPLRTLTSLHDRGRSALDSAAQAAESFVRQHIGEAGLEAFSVAALEPQHPGSARHEVRHRDGRRWTVVGGRVPRGTDGPESCGKPPVPILEWQLRLE
jgi:hypothetical protein